MTKNTQNAIQANASVPQKDQKLLEMERKNRVLFGSYIVWVVVSSLVTIGLTIILRRSDDTVRVANETLAWNKAAAADDRASSALVGLAAANVELGLANERAGGLEVKAAELQERAANAESKAAEAMLAAETERIERLRMEAELSPRRIPPGAREELAARLSEFRGLSVSVTSLTNDLEGAMLASQIVDLLRECGMVVEANIGGFMPFGGVGAGVQIQGKNRALAMALSMGLLKDAGLVGFLPRASEDSEVRAFAENPAAPRPDATIMVRIKPIKNAAGDPQRGPASN